MKSSRLMLLISSIIIIGSADAQWPDANSTSKPWTRWWWHGSAVEEGEITRELENLERAGFGGVEITPIYGVQGEEAHEKEFLSAEWLGLVKHACLEARRLGLEVDIVPGTGWRLGNENIPEEERAVMLKLEIEHAGGGKSYRAIAGLSGERVKRPAPGGSGFTLDMLNHDAVQHYMDWFNKRFFSEIPPGLVRGVFHDSWEYETDWTHDFAAEFKRRRGMELSGILPVFDPDNSSYPADTTERWRYAYRQTLDELLLENFCDTWNDSVHGKGLLSRNQAHGSIANLLDVYARADIPETEIFRDEENFLIHKFASSAAHVSGKNLVSSESFTWLSEHWTSDLAKIKKFADYLFLCGINHIFYHGTAYSPDEAPWPGWVFYASTQFNDRNPLWNHLPDLNHYITRCQGLLQTGKPYTEAYLYWPIADLYAEAPGTKIRQNISGRNWFIGSRLEKTARRLWDSGIHFDYISDRQLQEFAREGKSLPAIILPPLGRIPLATVEALDKLSRKGAGVFALNSPSSWKSTEILDNKEVESRMMELLEEAAREQRIRTIEDIGAIGLGEDGWQATSGLRCIRRVLDDGSQVYFITNWSNQRCSREIPLMEGALTCERLDAWTGKAGHVKLEKGGILDLTLDPFQSTFLRVGGEQSTNPWPESPGKPEFRILDVPWTLSFVNGGPELPEPMDLEHLDWINRLGDPVLERFAGLLQYESHIILSEEDLEHPLALDLGSLSSSAQVFINGKLVGTSIRAPYLVDLPIQYLVAGRNELVVQVATLAENRIRHMDRTGQPWRIFKDINFVNIDYKAFDASGWAVRNYGLKGPVRLVTGSADSF